MDDRDCLENSCTLRGTVGSNPTLSVNLPEGEIRTRSQFSVFSRELVAHLQKHHDRQEHRVFRKLDDNRLVVVTQYEVG